MLSTPVFELTLTNAFIMFLSENNILIHYITHEMYLIFLNSIKIVCDIKLNYIPLSTPSFELTLTNAFIMFLSENHILIHYITHEMYLISRFI